MLSVDENGIYRTHKLRSIRLMAEKDFSIKNSDFPQGEDPMKITNLKNATYKQWKDVNVISDYVFCTQLTSNRLTFLEPERIQQMSQLHWYLKDANTKVKVTNIIHHHGLVICSILMTPSVNCNQQG